MKELVQIQSELKAPKGQFNKFGGYKYRNCEDILEALKPLLLQYKCYLTIQDEPIMIGEWHYIKATATITNESGTSISSTAFAREEESKKGMDGAQLTGATSSYARKYALNGLFCIDDTKDADATNTHGKDSAPAPAPAPEKAETKPLTPSGTAGTPTPKASIPPQANGQDGQVLIGQVLAEINSAQDGKELTAIYKKYKSTFQGADNETFVNAIKSSPVNPNRKK